MKPAPRSGSMTMTRAMRRLRVAEQQRVADLQAERVEQRRRRPTPCRAPAPPRRRRAGRAGRAAHAAACRAADSRRCTALTATSRVAPPLSSGARPMLGKLGVVAVAQAERRARASTNAGGVGWSLATIASPPSSWRASRARPPLRRSAKKPTAVSAATASITATTSRRSSPARKSRSSWRQRELPGRRRASGAACASGRPCATVRAAAGLDTQRCAERAIGVANAACNAAERRGARGASMSA